MRAAEANLHSASALVGVAIAARLPNIVLSANGGATAFNFAQIFAPGTGFYTIGAGITAPIFDGFTLYNKQKAAEAALDQADAQYRATVVTAFQNVADALRALQADARAVQAAVRAETAAKASLDIVQTAAERRSGQPARRAERAADLSDGRDCPRAGRANRLSDTAALFMALGGGWPAGCTSPDWRQCAMGEAAGSTQHLKAKS